MLPFGIGAGKITLVVPIKRLHGRGPHRKLGPQTEGTHPNHIGPNGGLTPASPRGSEGRSLVYDNLVHLQQLAKHHQSHLGLTLRARRRYPNLLLQRRFLPLR